jgi:tape measure domain-containing protein
MAQPEYLDIIGRDKASPIIDKIGRSLGTLAKIAGVAFGTREIFQAVGAYQDFSNKIKNATNASQDFAKVQNEVFQIATQNGRSLAETASLYSSLQLVTQEAGFSGQEFNNLIKTINNSLKINNTTTQDAAALTDNLSKAFVKGSIDGRDFTQLLNANRNVVERLAAATGKSIPELAKIARDTGIPVQALTLALQATEQSAEKLAQTTDLKLNSALTIAGNNASKFFGELDKATGASTLMGKSIILASENLGVLIVGFGTFFALVTVARLSAITAAMNAFMASLIPGGPIIRGVIVAVSALAAGLTALMPKLKGVAEGAVDAADGFMSADDSMNGYGETLQLVAEKQKELNRVNDEDKAAQAKAALETQRYKKFEEFYSKQLQSVEVDERGKLLAEARLALGQGEVLNAEQLLRLKTLQDKIDAKAAERALPSIISETGGAFGEGSAEQKALEQKQKDLQKARDTNLINEETYLRNMQILQEDYDRKKLEANKNSIDQMVKQILAGNASALKIQALSDQDKIKLAVSTGLELLNEAGKYNKTAFNAAKALAISMAIINGIDATISSYRTGSQLGGPILGAVFAAVTAATIAAQVSKIRSTQYTGARRQGGLVGENQSYLVGEDGPEMFTPSSSGRITPNDQISQGVTVNFNISTVDADGFDEILINRRSTIVGIINEATNKRGRVGVTQ